MNSDMGSGSSKVGLSICWEPKAVDPEGGDRVEGDCVEGCIFLFTRGETPCGGEGLEPR